MATKKKAKTKKKAGAKTKTSKSSKVLETGKKVLSSVTGKKNKATGRRRKRGALWYAKEIQRLKLKKRYEKIKYRV